VPLLDLARVAEQPKAIVGYSDATSLLNAAVAAGMVAVHGPMVAADVARGLTARSIEWLHRLLTDAAWLWEAEVPETIRPGTATGPLIGGCLSVARGDARHRPGPPTRPGRSCSSRTSASGRFRLDRLLTHLRQAGKLDGVAGVVFGTMATCPVVDDVGARDVIRACFADAPYPVGFGLPAGHHPMDAGEAENLALPLGIRVTLDTERGQLRALEYRRWSDVQAVAR